MCNEKSPETENLRREAQNAAESAAQGENTAQNGAETPSAAQNAAQELAAQLAALQQQHLRMLAEYDNYRKRSQREREGTYTDAVCATVAAFLPVLDNLDRARAQESSDEVLKKGLELIAKQFTDTLEKLGVKAVCPSGEQFDPALHHAMMHVEDEHCDDNTVVEVFQKGYTLQERVVRHAMVKVAN